MSGRGHEMERKAARGRGERAGERERKDVVSGRSGERVSMSQGGWRDGGRLRETGGMARKDGCTEGGMEGGMEEGM